eukprot:CAMPEP_0114545932 /NCGR_PEP_ID=MMETSP0114-20121206/3671_1 /TAXON_ID=31324 /ORGANISM="Goniomonas sp, Strain m" /LENGTH=971 /DNA_ID=CAMNT_0001730407 /DNA_START=48 /DNA_END=2963 /DNA_ORIENTATION=-
MTSLFVSSDCTIPTPPPRRLAERLSRRHGARGSWEQHIEHAREKRSRTISQRRDRLGTLLDRVQQKVSRAKEHEEFLRRTRKQRTDKRMERASVRRRDLLNQRVRKAARFAKGPEEERHTSAATHLQRWWRHMAEFTSKSIVRVFLEQGGSLERVKRLSFDTLAKLILQDSVKSSTNKFLRRMQTLSRSNQVISPKVFLASLMLSVHPDQAMESPEPEINSAAAAMLAACDAACTAIMTGGEQPLRRVATEFVDAANVFERLFSAWQKRGAAKLADELVASYKELVAALEGADEFTAVHIRRTQLQVRRQLERVAGRPGLRRLQRAVQPLSPPTPPATAQSQVELTRCTDTESDSNSVPSRSDASPSSDTCHTTPPRPVFARGFLNRERASKTPRDDANSAAGGSPSSGCESRRTTPVRPLLARGFLNRGGSRGGQTGTSGSSRSAGREGAEKGGPGEGRARPESSGPPSARPAPPLQHLSNAELVYELLVSPPSHKHTPSSPPAATATGVPDHMYTGVAKRQLFVSPSASAAPENEREGDGDAASSAARQFEQRLTECMRKAYWDSIQVEMASLAAGGTDCPRVTALLTELRDLLVSLAPTSANLRERVEAALDLAVFAQQAQHGTLDAAYVRGLLSATYAILTTLQSPARDAPTAAAWKEKLSRVDSPADQSAWASAVCAAFEFLLESVQQVKADAFATCANTVGNLVHTHGLEYLRSHTQALREKGLFVESKVAQWLTHATRDCIQRDSQLREKLAQSDPTALQEVHRQAILKLVTWQSTSALDTVGDPVDGQAGSGWIVPATLSLAAQRLKELRAAFHAEEIAWAALIALQPHLGAARGLSEREDAVCEALLDAAHTASDGGLSAAALLEAVRATSTPLPASVPLLSAAVDQHSPLRKLVHARLASAWAAHLVPGATAPAVPVSLVAHVTGKAEALRRVAEVDEAVHGGTWMWNLIRSAAQANEAGH